jgi:biotin operon repressor
MTKKTPDYREILQLHSENNYSQQKIADSVGSSKMTVIRH